MNFCDLRRSWSKSYLDITLPWEAGIQDLKSNSFVLKKKHTISGPTFDYDHIRCKFLYIQEAPYFLCRLVIILNFWDSVVVSSKKVDDWSKVFMKIFNFVCYDLMVWSDLETTANPENVWLATKKIQRLLSLYIFNL